MDSHGKSLLKKFLALGYDPELFKDTYGVSMSNSRNTANLRGGLSYKDYYDDLRSVRGKVPKFPSYNIPLENPVEPENNELYELLDRSGDGILYDFSIENPDEYPAVNSARFFNNVSDEDLLKQLQSAQSVVDPSDFDMSSMINYFNGANLLNNTNNLHIQNMVDMPLLQKQYPNIYNAIEGGYDIPSMAYNLTDIGRWEWDDGGIPHWQKELGHEVLSYANENDYNTNSPRFNSFPSDNLIGEDLNWYGDGPIPGAAAASAHYTFDALSDEELLEYLKRNGLTNI